MSFILDALRKSEQERQRNVTPGMVQVRGHESSARTRIWVTLVAVLVVSNIILIASLWLAPTPQPDVSAPPLTSAPQESPATQSAVTTSAARPDPPPAQQPDRFSESRDLSAELTEPNNASAKQAAIPAPAQAGPPPASKPTNQSTGTYIDVPSLAELTLAGSLKLPPLHLDMHVYSENPAERFVFINMAKHREGGSLSEGPAVDTITKEGVILSYQGRRFLLTRE